METIPTIYPPSQTGILEIKRYEKNENVVHSKIFVNDNFMCEAFENRHYLIKAGIYRAKKYDSPKMGFPVLLLDVPKRAYIEVHPANRWDELRGCIAPVTVPTGLGGLESRIAFQRVYAHIIQTPYMFVKITEHYTVSEVTA